MEVEFYLRGHYHSHSGLLFLDHSQLPGKYTVHIYVYSPGNLLGAHQIIKCNSHLFPHRFPLYSWVKRGNSWLCVLLKPRTQELQPAWLGFKPTFWWLSHQNFWCAKIKVRNLIAWLLVGREVYKDWGHHGQLGVTLNTLCKIGNCHMLHFTGCVMLAYMYIGPIIKVNRWLLPPCLDWHWLLSCLCSTICCPHMTTIHTDNIRNVMII